MSKLKLRRCPFCGGKATLSSNYSNGWHYVRAYCVVCDSQGKSFRSKDDPESNDWDTLECRKAVAAWNLRAYDRIDPDDIDVAEYKKEFGHKN